MRRSRPRAPPEVGRARERWCRAIRRITLAVTRFIRCDRGEKWFSVSGIELKNRPSARTAWTGARRRSRAGGATGVVAGEGRGVLHDGIVQTGADDIKIE